MPFAPLFGLCTVIDGLQGNFAAPRFQTTPFSASSGYQNSTSVVPGVTEIASAPNSYPTLTTTNATMSPARVSVDIPVSKQLFAQSKNQALESLLRREILKALSSVAEYYFWLGGTGITGLLNITENTANGQDQSKLSPGVTFGSAATWSSVVSFFSGDTGQSELCRRRKHVMGY
jgi:hypothetical protein